MANWVRYPPPLKRGISAILPRYPMKTRQMGAIPPCAILSRKGIARYGGVSRTGLLRSRRECHYPLCLLTPCLNVPKESACPSRKAFMQRRDYLAKEVEKVLNDTDVKLSEKLRKALQQFLLMRSEPRSICQSPLFKSGNPDPPTLCFSLQKALQGKSREKKGFSVNGGIVL